MRKPNNKDQQPRVRPSPARPHNPSTMRKSKGLTASASRTVIEHVTARVIYRANESEYVRIRCEEKGVHLVHVATGEPYPLLAQKTMSRKLFESMIARKLITRRVTVEVRHAFANALRAYYEKGLPLGEFVVLKVARTQVVRHTPGARARAHTRTKLPRRPS